VVHVVVSSCLLGNPVRHDARNKRCEHPVLLRWIEEGRVIPACPEMLGGLGTPRPPAEIVIENGARRVVTNTGRDVTREFEEGAQATLDEAVRYDVRVAILKSNSPSCGSSFVYNGSFTSTRVPGEGITTALLRQRGIAVFSEDELDAAEAYVASLEG
jgi:uncharacterized protein YbbK (DUF523 family)